MCFFASLALCGMAASQAADAPTGPSADAFEQALTYVYRQNPKLIAERQTLAIEDEHVSQAYSGFRPTLNADAAAGRQRVNADGGDWLYGPDTSGSLTAIQPLFNGFGTLEQFRAAKARVTAGRARLMATEQEVLLTAISAWLEMCEKERLVALHLDNWNRLYKYYSATEQRFKAGDGTRTDIVQSEARLAEAEAHYDLARADMETARANYVRVTGLAPPKVFFPPFPVNLPATPGEAERLARDNPELAQADAEEIAAQHDIEASSSSLWPSVYVRGNMNTERSPELGLERLRDDSITLNVSVPLYQGGAEYSRVREAKIAREKSRENDMDTLLAAVERARQSWFNYDASCKVILASQKASEAAMRGLAGVQEERAQGSRTTLDVLNAEAELLGARIAETQAHKNARLEAYRLLASVGRLTAEGLHLPTALYNPQLHYDDTAKRAIGF